MLKCLEIFDIIINACFKELTDVDILNESEEGAEELITALAEAEAPALLLHNLSRLDEQVPDERDAVHNTLGIPNEFFISAFDKNF